MRHIFPLILVGVFLNCGAQLSLKAGMNRIGHFDFALANLFNIGSQIVTSPLILTGLAAYVFSVGVWLLVLSRVNVGIAYPMVSLGYIINAITAYYLFGEALTITRLMGIIIILCGVFLVASN